MRLSSGSPLVIASIMLASVLPQAADRREVQPPAGPGSGMYSLASRGDGSAYLGWIEPLGGKLHALKFSILRGEAWSPAREIARGENWFVNWADHPSVVPLPDGTLVAHWLVSNDARQGSYAYGFRIAISKDGGTSWREIYAGGADNRRGYSGFVSLLPEAGGFTAVFLGPPPMPVTTKDERGGRDAHAEHTMMLTAVRFGPDGRVKHSAVADPNACSCCSTSLAATGRGPLAAYRDRTSGEIRDIAVVRYERGAWSSPRTVHDDGWHINACPTNGPALSSSGSRVAMSWFTGAGQQPRVKVAFSSNAGDSFSTPTVVDDGRPAGWPGTVLLDDGSAVVSWLESLGNGRGEIRLRRAWPSGRLSEPIVVATAGSGRSTGIPQLARIGKSLVVAWRTDRVQTAIVPIPEP